MSVLITPIDADASVWIAAVRRELPAMDVRCWPDVGDPSNIELAIIGILPHGQLAQMPRLRLIASIYGQDILLADPALPPAVPIVRTDDPDGDPMMAEFALLHVLRHHRNLPAYARAQAAGRWGRLPQPRTHERRVGIMGLGPIGRRTARTLATAGFEVSAWTRRPHDTPSGVRTYHGREQLPAFLSTTEILINLLPLTRETENILDRTTLGMLPRGASLINLARGQHVVDEDLLELLGVEHLSAATLDAFRIEPLPPMHPFWTHPAITITPHAARRLDIEGIVRRAAAQWRRLEQHQHLEQQVDRVAGY